METTVRRFWDEKEADSSTPPRTWPTATAALPPSASPSRILPRRRRMRWPRVLDRLDVLADREDFGEKAEATLALFAPKAGQYGLFAATYGLALLHHLRAPVDVVVVGRADDDRTTQLLRAAYDAPRAGKRVFAFEPCSREGPRPARRTCRHAAGAAFRRRSRGAGLRRLRLPRACANPREPSANSKDAQFVSRNRNSTSSACASTVRMTSRAGSCTTRSRVRKPSRSALIQPPSAGAFSAAVSGISCAQPSPPRPLPVPLARQGAQSCT
jgi:hypothetical protein